MTNENDVCRCGHLRKNHGNPIFPCMADGCECSGFKEPRNVPTIPDTSKPAEYVAPTAK